MTGELRGSSYFWKVQNPDGPIEFRRDRPFERLPTVVVGYDHRQRVVFATGIALAFLVDVLPL